MSAPINRFTKPALDPEQQIAQLRGRGLIINDEAQAKVILRATGYFRFCGYAQHWRPTNAAGSPNFPAGLTFDEIVVALDFDRRLRIHIMDAIDRIEVAVRSSFSNALATAFGSHWYLRANLFSNLTEQHTDIIREIKHQIGHNKADKREDFVDEYYNTYNDPDMPPSWMVFEVLSLGAVSRIYANIVKSCQKSIGNELNLHRTLLVSWLHAISILRNYCAHHSRLWNRNFPVKPIIQSKHQIYCSHEAIDKNGNKIIEIGDYRLHTQLLVLHSFLSSVSTENGWVDRLFDLLQSHPSLDKSVMGFPPDWAGFP